MIAILAKNRVPKRATSLAVLLSLVVPYALAVQPDTAENTPRVLTSFLPVQAHTAAIMGEGAGVEQLLSADAGPHDFQLTPSTVRKLADADLFIINGAGIEDWMEDLIQRAGNKQLVIVDTSAGVTLLDSPHSLRSPTKIWSPFMMRSHIWRIDTSSATWDTSRSFQRKIPPRKHWRARWIPSKS